MINIRKATPQDAPAIIDFQVKMAWETEEYVLSPEKVSAGVKGVFDNPVRGQYWIAENNGLVIASLLITYEWSDWRNCNVWWFQSVYVLPEYRRMGVFRSMYLRIKQEAEKEGVAGLRLYVETKNERARQTYASLGMNHEHYTMYEWLRD